MKKVKNLLLISIVIALSFSLIGCGLIASRDAATDVEPGATGELPKWLTLAHRAEAAEEPAVEEEEVAVEEETPAETQPVATQPAATQPAQQTQQPAQQPAQTGPPLWQQPGTMEYIAKIRLDEMVAEYKRLINSGVKADAEGGNQEVRLAALTKNIPEVANGLGINIKEHYGLSISTSQTGGPGDFFSDFSKPGPNEGLFYHSE